MAIAVLVAIALICGVICHTIAKRRGAAPMFWGAMGVIFGPLAIPLVFLSRKHQRDE